MASFERIASGMADRPGACVDALTVPAGFETQAAQPPGGRLVRSRRVMTPVDRLAELSDHGVSIWLDSLNRERLRGGGLAGLVRDRHVVGVTTNPTIFEQSLANGAQYDRQAHDLGLRGVSPEEAAVADHALIGTDTVQSSYEDVTTVLEALPRVGVDHEVVISVLERDGVHKFVGSWNELLSNLRAGLRAERDRRPRMQSK